MNDAMVDPRLEELPSRSILVSQSGPRPPPDPVTLQVKDRLIATNRVENRHTQKNGMYNNCANCNGPFPVPERASQTC
eukprot:COSAG03_NODE_20_length_21605_cov_27.875523_16_plen_78_part_00